MRYILIWELLSFNAETHHVTWESGMEIHTCAYACNLARSELYALTRIKSACISQADILRAPRPEGARPGKWINGRYLSRYQP